jgi:hypothetical protein
MLSARLQRYVPLLVWMAVVATMIFVPLKIISYGYLPTDDALRHAAKAISGKPWSDILVLRSDFALDHNPGWHVLLGAAHRHFGWGADGLVSFSVFALACLVGLAPLPWLRRPEAWLGVWLAAAPFMASSVHRLTLGRPFLLTTAALMVVLLAWNRERDERPGAAQLAWTTLLLAACTWIHGAWYLFALPVAAFFLSGLWRTGAWLGGCWLAGSVGGAALTGHPLDFLRQAVAIMFNALGGQTLTRMLALEFQPSNGETGALLMLAAMLFWLALSPSWDRRMLRHPALILAILSWLLGLKVTRFWLDWGAPALLVWLALALQTQLDRYVRVDSGKRLWLSAALAAGVFWGMTGDREGRWTRNLRDEYLEADNPQLAGWLPDQGGIIYSVDMSVFYGTFFKNPSAPWRYVFGFEPTFMLPDDLAVLRQILWNAGDPRAYQPWVQKMRPEDRLVIRASTHQGAGVRPAIPELEWYYAVSDMWVGRLPRGAKPAPAVVKPGG